MQNEIALLRKLQDYDLRILELDERTDTLRDALEELYALRDALVASLEQQKQQLEETRLLMRNKQVDLEANEERYGQSKSKINQITNSKEYAALEKEIETLRKLRAQLEEEHDSLKDAVSDFTADVEEKEAKAAEVNKQIADEEALVDRESSATEKEIGKLESERDKLKKDLPKALVRRYEFITSRRPGKVIVPARGGVCTGCNMMLPPQLYNEVQQATRMQQCPSCQRILYYENEEELAAAEA
ncbi:MAG: hypothetical protein EA398_09275 [Deltaproteobacteria bacterium]|nr:MAG: hypothetical protein EA398_09275 [Deltaproteobacteria bacterium]